MLTYFFMAIAAYAFLGNFIFSLATQKSIAPEHRVSRVYGAIIGAVAGVSYLLITHFYHELLHEVSKHGAHSAEAASLMRRSYQAIGQYRYMDWAITTPLLLLKTTSMLRISSKEAGKAIAVLLLADFWMVLTGYIGEQQLTPTGEIIGSSAGLPRSAVHAAGLLPTVCRALQRARALGLPLYGLHDGDDLGRVPDWLHADAH